MMPHMRWMVFVCVMGLLVNCTPPPPSADMRGASATVVPTPAATNQNPAPTPVADATTAAPPALPLGDGKFSQTGQL